MTDQAPSVPRRGVVFFDFVTHFGGAQRSTVSLCQALVQDYDVRVVDAYGVSHDWLAALNEAKVPIHVLLPRARRPFIGHEGRPLRRFFGALAQIPELMELRRTLRRYLGRVRPDLVLTNSTKALALLWLAGAFSRHRIVFYARGWYQRCQVSVLGRWLIRKAHCVLAVSTATANALQEWGVALDKVRVVHTLIDPEEVQRAGAMEVTDRPPHADRSVRILLPAQLLRTKGQRAAVEAAGILKGHGLDLVMWLAGDAKMGSNGQYREELVEEIARRGLQEQVFLLGPRPDVPALIRLADVVILPTHSEGFPRAVWEAQVLERPVVSTPVGGVTDLIDDGQTGLLAPVDDALALAQSIGRLCADETLRTRIVQNAVSQIRLRFTYTGQQAALRTALGSVRQEVFHEAM
jgi:glycosyltransferase involved in cell wall biosynthesis